MEGEPVTKRGPRQRPTALKLLHGERHLDRINRDEPVPRAAMPDPPADLTDEVADVWRATVRELAAMNLAFACDVESLRAYAEAVVVHRKACKVIGSTAILVKRVTQSGEVWVRNPALQVQRDAALTLLRFAQEFGLTPSARSSIKATEAAAGGADENPFAGSG